MRNRAAGWIAIAAVVVLVAGCDAESSAPAEHQPSRPETAGAPAPHSRIDVAARSQAEVAAFVEAWRHSDDDGRRAAEDRLVAAGTPAAEQVLALVETSEGEDGPNFWRLFPRFGADAVRPLVARLSSPDARVRACAMNWLGRLAPNWTFGNDGEFVCRALVVRLRDPEDAASAAAALQTSRPAGRTVAAEVAKLWRAADVDARSQFAQIVVALGPDAAPAAPLAWDELLAAGDGRVGAPLPDDRRTGALEILAATRVADASRLDLLLTLLDSTSNDVRAGAVQVIENLGDAAAPATTRLLALLGDGDEVVRGTAKQTLLAMEPKDDRLWSALLAKDADLAERLAKTPDGAALLMRLLPALPADALSSVSDALAFGGVVGREQVAAAMMRHPLPEARALAPRLWLRDDDSRPPKEALVLLADADPRVRAAALDEFAPTGVVPDEKLLVDALQLVASDDPEVRIPVLRALGWMSEREPKARDALLTAMTDSDADMRTVAINAIPSEGATDAAVRRALVKMLDDADWGVRDAAESALTWIELPEEDIRRAMTAKVVESLLRGTESSGWERRIEELSRLAGGLDALAAAIRPWLASGEEADWSKRRDALRIAGELASRMPSIRDDLVHLLENGGASDRSEIEDALSHADLAAATDPEAIARGRWDDFRKLAKLRTLGPAGLHAFVLVAAMTSRPDDLRKQLADVDLRAEVVAAAAADGADAAERRKGAAVLAPLLPDADAVATLTKLATDDDARQQVVDSLELVAKRKPESVPASLVVRLLHHRDGTRDWTGLSLVPFAGRAVAELDPALVTELAKFRDDGTPAARARSAAMLFHLTGRADEALPTFRALLALPERLTGGLPWRTIGDVLRRVPLSADDVAAFVPTLQRAASCCDPPEMDQDNGPGEGDFVQGSLTAIVPALEHCGPAAAAAVPALALVVSKWSSDSEPGACAVRVLGAIGLAARSALPDLRRAIAMCQDPSPVRDAIRRIESAAK